MQSYAFFHHLYNDFIIKKRQLTTEILSLDSLYKIHGMFRKKYFSQLHV